METSTQANTPKKRVSVLGNGSKGASTTKIYQSASRWAETGRTGIMVSGTFTKSIQDENYDSTHYEIKADSAGEYIDGDGNLKSFNAGDSVVVNGTSGLAKKMANIPEGAGLEIEYLGQVTLTRGKFKGKAVHNFDVRVDEDVDLIADEDIA